MSGGHWDHFEIRFKYELEEFCEEIKERFPNLSKELLNKGKSICEIIHDIDYDFCGDTLINNDHDFEIGSIEKLNLDNAIGLK